MPLPTPPLLRVAGLALLALAACQSPDVPGPAASGTALDGLPAPPDTPPEWAADAVWYQVFPERFDNADPGNDPTPESMEGAWPQVGADSLRAAGWAPKPWTSDWFAAADWETRLRPDDRYFTIQARRYGGDLQGVIDRLPYLDSLGVTALYLNPVNDSPSLHKYDARSYHHVDPHFGPDPEGDREQIALEDPADPETWSTTAADSLLLALIEDVHGATCGSCSTTPSTTPGPSSGPSRTCWRRARSRSSPTGTGSTPGTTPARPTTSSPTPAGRASRSCPSSARRT